MCIRDSGTGTHELSISGSMVQSTESSGSGTFTGYKVVQSKPLVSTDTLLNADMDGSNAGNGNSAGAGSYNNIIGAGAGLTGGSGTDRLEGGKGNDILTGNGGIDTIAGGAGNDTINGNAGDDIITGGGGTDIVDGGADNDTITMTSGTNSITGGAGNDIITLGSGVDTLVYGATATATGVDVVGTFKTNDIHQFAAWDGGTVTLANATSGTAITLSTALQLSTQATPIAIADKKLIIIEAATKAAIDTANEVVALTADGQALDAVDTAANADAILIIGGADDDTTHYVYAIDNDNTAALANGEVILMGTITTDITGGVDGLLTTNFLYA